MHDGQHVLDHFLLRAQAFLVHDHEVAVMRAAQMLDHLEAEAAQAVAVGHDQTLDAPEGNRIEDPQEALAPEIEAAADFLDPFAYGPSVGRTELLQHADLVVEVRFLSLRRHPRIGGGNPLIRDALPTRAKCSSA